MASTSDAVTASAPSMVMRMASDIGDIFWSDVLHECFMVALFVLLYVSIRRAARKSRTLKSWRSAKVLPQVTQCSGGHSPKGHQLQQRTTETSTGVSAIPILVKSTVEMRYTAARVMDGYKELRKAGDHFHIIESLAAAGSKYTVLDFYTGLVQCAGRRGQAVEVAQLLDDMEQVGVERPLAVYEMAMKLLATMKCFDEALSVYDRLVRDNLEATTDTLSCLISFAWEAGNGERALDFFKQLSAREAPNARACVTILRVLSRQGDWESSVALVKRNWELGVHMTDAPLLNLALATCVSVDQVGAAESLVKEAPLVSTDAVSYNTIVKGFAKGGNFERALATFRRMGEVDIAANLITYNILIDCAVKAARPKDAWTLFAAMKQFGLRPDKCTCSTLIKALRSQPSVPHLEEIVNMIDEVETDCTPACIKGLLSCSVCVALRVSHLRLAMRVYSGMRKHRLTPTPAELRSLSLLWARTGNAAWEDPGVLGEDPDCPNTASKRLAALDQQLAKDAALVS